MPSPLSVIKNDFRTNPKPSDIYTPHWLSQQIHEIASANGEMRYHLVLDPAIGGGSLTEPFQSEGLCRIIGVDINPAAEPHADKFYCGKFEDVDAAIWSTLSRERPELIVCNPPFNSASGRKLYPEVFLRHIHELWGTKISLVMIVPMGMRLNQRKKSSRWKYMRDNWQIDGIMSLPIDAFDGVLFHAEVLFFNMPYVPAHIFPNIPEG